MPPSSALPVASVALPLSVPAEDAPQVLTFDRSLAEHTAVVAAVSNLRIALTQAAELCIDSLRRGGKALFMGNGGSASDAQHLAAELVGRFRRERRGLPGVALTTDSSILTAIANDYGYDHIFARQIEALCRPGDVVVGISTSGNSANVLRGIDEARRLGARTIGFTGESGGEMAAHCDLCLRVPSTNTARIQEMHILLGHVLCDLVEEAFA